MNSFDQHLTSCQEPTIWEIGNQTLYDLCEKYPAHTDPSQIVAKTWLIGRTYSVALERRKGATESNEIYYREKIPQVFISSKLDEWLLKLPSDQALTSDLLVDVLKIHTALVDYLKSNLGITEGNDGLKSNFILFKIPTFPLSSIIPNL